MGNHGGHSVCLRYGQGTDRPNVNNVSPGGLKMETAALYAITMVFVFALLLGRP